MRGEDVGNRAQPSIGLVRPKLWLLLAAFVPWTLALITVAMAIARAESFPLVHSVIFGACGAAALRNAFLSTKNATIVHDRLAIDGRELRFGRRLLARRADITQGFLVPEEDRLLVRLDRRWPRPPVVLAVRDEETGRSLLRALGLDAEHVTAEMRIASGVEAMSTGRQVLFTFVSLGVFCAATLAAISFFSNAAFHAIQVLSTAFALSVLGIVFAPMSVRIGSDGILTSWLGRRRFVPFARIRSASTYEETVGTKRKRGVRLVLADGETVTLPTGQSDVAATEARRLLRRIEDARAARAAGARPVEVLTRGGRSFVEWVRDLRRIGAGAQGHRTAAVAPDVLLRVVEDGAASAVERASAAVAAVASADPDAKRRVRVAADMTVSPRLRVALTRIAESSDADEAEIAAALEQLGEERSRARR